MRRRLPITVASPWTSRSPYWLWEAVCAGCEPAEALDTRDREDLIAGLHARGWTDPQIAQHTKTSTYVVTRIRERLRLPAHRPPRKATAA